MDYSVFYFFDFYIWIHSLCVLWNGINYYDSNITFLIFLKKKILTLPWLSILSQDHELFKNEDLVEETDKYTEGKKKDTEDNKSVPKDDHSDTDNSVKKVLTAIKNVWWYVLKSWDPAQEKAYRSPGLCRGQIPTSMENRNTSVNDFVHIL